MVQCNCCERRNCQIIRAARKNKGLTDEEMQAVMSQSCASAILPKPWSQPVILSALATHPQGVNDVLQAHEMYFQELKDKPFFRILLREIQ